MTVLRGAPAGGRIRETLLMATMAALAFLILAPAPRSLAASCLAPITIADRWDDVTAVAGYTGGSRKTPDWRNDGVWDHEAFTDQNGNGVYDAGEPFIDANANGRFDAELYGPVLTGYLPAPDPANVISPSGDLGLQLTLAPAAAGDESPGRYVSLQVDCDGNVSGAERATGRDLRTIDLLLRDLIASDPGASWDEATNTIVGSAFPDGSPRVMLLPLYDPRTPLAGAHGTVQLTKILGAFVEAMVAKGSAAVRVVPVPAPAPGSIATGVSAAAGSSAPAASVPAKATWGELKASYR
jgi:hypothetical protein